MDTEKLYKLAHDCLLDLSSEEGINASGKEEIFGCVFGRDSAITILKILKAHQKRPVPQLLEISRKALLGLITLQGKEFNLESNEEPGKFIHEFRKSKYDHLIKGNRPWFLYPKGVLKNYDSIDSTPLILIALYRYWQLTQDNEFLLQVLPAVEAGLNWIITYGDLDKDYFVEYQFHKMRRFGGLAVHSWTDSHQALADKAGNFPPYPIAPIEVQAFSWLSLKLWASFYLPHSPTFAKKLLNFTERLKAEFNDKFILETEDLFFGTQALDGNKKQIKTITANPALVLWAAFDNHGQIESILNSNFIEHFVQRIFQEDLFVEGAGVRTMSSKSPTFNPHQDSYHNGSFWPMLNGLIAEGLENFGFRREAQKIKEATLLPLQYFGYPIELYIQKDGQYLEYHSSSGQSSCKTQAWSAAALLDMAAD